MSDMDSDEEITPLVQQVIVGVTAVTLTVAFGLMAIGVQSFWIVFVIGFSAVLPSAIMLAQHYEKNRDEGRSKSTAGEDALEQLRERYAQGEITEEEFDRRVERLLETETVDDAKVYVEGGQEGDDDGPNRDPERYVEMERE